MIDVLLEKFSSFITRISGIFSNLPSFPVNNSEKKESSILDPLQIGGRAVILTTSSLWVDGPSGSS